MKRNCVICNSSSVRTIFKNKLSKFNSIDLSYTISYCKKCGCTYAAKIASENTINSYYKQFSKYDLIDSPINVPSITDEISIHITNCIRRSDLNPKSVFDIGCSYGNFLHHIKNEFDCDVNGIDPAPNARFNAKILYNIDIITGFYNADVDLQNYDLITVNSVLEHIIDVKLFIQNISVKTANDTFLSITVPSADDFKMTEGEWLGEFSNEHINYFSKKSLKDLLLQFNYTLISSESIKLSNGQYIIVCVFKKENTHNQLANFSFSETSIVSIKTYLKKSKNVLSDIKNIINDNLVSPYIIWGAGSHTQKLLCTSLFRKCKPEYIIDSNERYTGSNIAGIKIIHPKNVQNMNVYKSIIVSSYNAQESIKKALHSINFTGKIICFY